jgi:PucR C-terminal helix-turn-helix domain
MLAGRPWEELPTLIAPAMRPGLKALAEEMIVTIRATVPAYSRPLEGPVAEGVRAGVEGALAQFLDVVERGHEGPLPERELYAELGRGEAREGRSLEALLAAYRVGARVAWRQAAARARELELDRDTLALLAESIFAYIDELSAASAEGYAREQSAAAGEADRRRAALARLLIAQPLEHRGSVPDVARAIHVHPQTVRYRLNQLRNLFGDELDDPDARFELMVVTRARTLRGESWP